jgi:GNAT superfamily N-acetyltransferase
VGVPVDVRPAQPTEYEAVGRLTVEAYDAVGQMTPEYREQLRDTAGRIAEGAEVLVAVDGDRVVGAVTYVDRGPHLEGATAGDVAFRMLAVDPAAQGRGVGEALVAACLDRARARGRRRVAIYSMDFMRTAHRLYGRFGFVRRPDRDVMFPSGLGLAFSLDLAPDAAAHFPPPGPVPDTPPWFEDLWRAEAVAAGGRRVGGGRG